MLIIEPKKSIMHKILVLGAGMVAKPLIDYLLEHNYKVTIACNTCDKARIILKDHPNGEILYWDANETEVLKPMVKEADLVVSLLPYKFHGGVAEVCIQHGKDMVTTSYIRDEMSGLDKRAREAGIIILNEIGLDPGIDHMSAMKIIDNIKSRGGSIEKFWSVCGALPAPEHIDNPMGYKFTWSPEGVLLAGMNNARYLDGGRIVTIEPEDLFKRTFDYNIEDVGTLEVYPNRDSISYIDIYGLEDIKTMFRGTFRYKGWCETIDAMKSVRLLNTVQEDFSGKTYADMMRDRLGGLKGNIKKQLTDHLSLSIDSAAIKSFEWLGLFSDKKILSFMKTPFDIVSGLMMDKMMLGEGERDMTVLKHIFLARHRDGSTEIISSQMVDYGSASAGGDTSVARTVALPAAIAARLITEGKISLKGVYRPVEKEIYMPVLESLEEMGIRTKEEYGLPESELMF